MQTKAGFLPEAAYTAANMSSSTDITAFVKMACITSFKIAHALGVPHPAP